MPAPEPKPLAVPSALTQISNLLLVQLFNWRWSWRGMVVLGIVAPALSIVILSRLVGERSDDFLSALLMGNLVLVLTFQNQSKVASHFAYMRITNTLNFFIGLPIRQGVLIVATALSFFVLSFPALLATSLLGARLLGIPLHPSPLLIAIAPLSATALAGIGAVVGTVTRSFEESGSLSLLVSLLLLAAGPVIVPANQLPAAVVELGKLNPATYVASALKQGLVGPVTAQLAIDLTVLTAAAIVSLILADRLILRQLRR